MDVCEHNFHPDNQQVILPAITISTQIEQSNSYLNSQRSASTSNLSIQSIMATVDVSYAINCSWGTV